MKLRFTILTLCIICALQSCKEDAAISHKFFDTANMDSAVKPGDNFFEFVNGKWIKNTVIPPTESEAGAFLDIYNRSKNNMKLIVEEAARASHEPGSIEQKVGDFYAAGMDSAAIEKFGYDPVKPYLKQVVGIKDAAGLMKFIAQQQTEFNVLLFGQMIGADEKNSTTNIAIYYQGGLGLPDRDYYFKTDSETQKVVTAYTTYLQKLFTLTGDDSVTAVKKTALVYDLEKQLAGSHKTNVELRDPQANYNKLSVEELDKQMPAFGWKSTLKEMGISADSVNVGQPAFYAKVNELLTTVPLDTWKAYLKAHLLQGFAGALSSDFVNARFDYTGKALSGQEKMKDRWERIINNVDANLGDALGQLYVKKYFTEDAKERMLQLVNNLQKAFEARIGKLDWMSDSTKQKAKEKLAGFIKKIGYPDKWKDYSKVTIGRDSYFNNLVACSKNEYAYQVAKVGKPVDKTEWLMSAPTVNAYYNPTINEIVFPAGILQFTFFDVNADDAINYGGIGMVIGHEMTHGFDDQGAQYDKDGNLKSWWSPEDYEKFKAKSQLVINEYNGFVAIDSMHVNGALTTGENIADLGGLAIAYDAFKMTKQGQDTAKIDGFTPDQRFFLSLGQIWRTKMKSELARQLVNTDPHSPPLYRVNGPLMNFTPFYKAFNIQPGDKMYKAEADRIKIW
ncbi:M13 family metallopeptidase [Foetidibacter luteolus]|uniref:M13 family metallopeptidase n=1 Tax=Foetidibacter luteolus TaxID=2608880 RepID=UPI00129AF534|nr:M13 family metallopeptidase [Foetidibacter luteolus]